MGLEKAIAHGKEHRKSYNDSRAVASECRNHGKCDYCLSNRMHSFEKQKQAAIQKLKEYWQGDGQDFSKSGTSPFLLLLKKVKNYRFKPLKKVRHIFIPIYNKKCIHRHLRPSKRYILFNVLVYKNIDFL